MPHKDEMHCQVIVDIDLFSTNSTMTVTTVQRPHGSRERGTVWESYQVIECTTQVMVTKETAMAMMATPKVMPIFEAPLLGTAIGAGEVSELVPAEVVELGVA